MLLTKKKLEPPQTFLQSECKFVAKQYLFKKVKFVLSEEDLNDYSRKSIGAYFVKCFNQVSVSKVGRSDGKRLWYEVKDVVYKGILEKRNAVVYSIRSKWEGVLTI